MVLVEPRSLSEQFADPHAKLVDILNRASSVYHNAPMIEVRTGGATQMDKIDREIHPLEQAYSEVKQTLRNLADGLIPIDRQYVPTIEGLKMAAKLLRTRLKLARGE